MATSHVSRTVPVDGSTNFASLRAGRSGQSIVGRLIRVWDSRNVKKQGEFMGITILLLDELDSVIHGFIPANRASYYRSELKVGSVLRVERFEVGKSSNTYKVTEHQFVIRFIPATRISEVKNGAPAINHDKFMIRSFDRLRST